MFQKYLNMPDLIKRPLCCNSHRAGQCSAGCFSLCAGISGNCTAGHGGGNHCFLIIQHVILVLVCLVLQALFYGWGLNLSHKAAYDTLLRLRTALQKRFEKTALGVIQDKGTGTVKKLFVDDVDSLEVLLAHSMPEGIANLMVPIAVYVAMFFVDWSWHCYLLASIPLSLVAI